MVRNNKKPSLRLLLAILLLGGLSFSVESEKRPVKEQWKQYEINPFAFRLAQPRPDPAAGGIVVADLTGDGLMDYLYTTPGSIGAYDHWGKPLWVKEEDIHLLGVDDVVGLPGYHGPGVQAGDVDGDDRVEVLFLRTDGRLVVCDGATGKVKRIASPALPQGAARWQHLVVGNVRGKGDRDIVLQTSGADQRPAGTFPAGRFVSVFAFENLEDKPLWTITNFHGQAHGPLKIADMDGDGRDEIVGLSIYDDDGTLLTDGEPPPGAWHIDSIAIADIRPDRDGLEVAVTVEGPRHVGLIGLKGPIWWRIYEHREADKVAVGEFDLTSPGLEIWGRGSFDSPDDMGQFVFDAQGNVIAFYELRKVAPPDWTENGVEVIVPIHWTGEPWQLLAAKERHKEGDVAIFDPMTGRFIERFRERAARLYVADVAGDWREEVIVVAEDQIRIYWNPKPNPHPNRPRLWTLPHYRRGKMNWNYYSP
ncbi:MAG: hypothetical protein NZ959_01345 [Armatimonadetes bacterium]|nr:hypothetical protein [Armatimonadota bacterium]MDW8122108.1 hypothetical protein [Armatimonadota bacterium]